MEFGAHLIHTRTRNKIHKSFTILDEDTNNFDDSTDSNTDNDLKLFAKCVVPVSYSNYGYCELSQVQANRIGFKAVILSLILLRLPLLLLLLLLLPLPLLHNVLPTSILILTPLVSNLHGT